MAMPHVKCNEQREQVSEDGTGEEQAKGAWTAGRHPFRAGRPLFRVGRVGRLHQAPYITRHHSVCAAHWHQLGEALASPGAAGEDEPRPEVLTRAAVLGTSSRWHHCRVMRQLGAAHGHALAVPGSSSSLSTDTRPDLPSPPPLLALHSTPLHSFCPALLLADRRRNILFSPRVSKRHSIDSWCQLCSGVPLAGTRTRQLAVLASWALERTCRRLPVPGLGAGIPLPLALSTASALLRRRRPALHTAPSIQHPPVGASKSTTILFHVPALRS